MPAGSARNDPAPAPSLAHAPLPGPYHRRVACISCNEAALVLPIVPHSRLSIAIAIDVRCHSQRAWVLVGWADRAGEPSETGGRLDLLVVVEVSDDSSNANRFVNRRQPRLWWQR